MLRIGIVGAATIAPVAIVFPAFRTESAEVVAVGAVRAGAAAAFAGRYGIPRAYSSYEAVVGDPSVDLVYIALAVRDHAAASIAAMEAGKHVLCEKPIAMNADEAREVVAVSRRTGMRVIEAFHYRYHPLFATLLSMRDEGAFGAVRALTSEISDVREFDPRSILHDPAIGGGTLLHAGCYAINWMCALTGEQPSVESAGIDPGPLGADAAIDAVLTFPGGTRSTLEATMAPGRSIKPGNRLTIHGELATATVENLIVPQYGHSVRMHKEGEPARVFTVAGNSSYDYQLSAVVSALDSGQTLPTEGDELIRGMTVIDAIYSAARRVAPRA